MTGIEAKGIGLELYEESRTPAYQAETLLFLIIIVLAREKAPNRTQPGFILAGSRLEGHLSGEE